MKINNSHWACEKTGCYGAYRESISYDLGDSYWDEHNRREAMIHDPKCPACRGKMVWIPKDFVRKIDETFDVAFQAWRDSSGKVLRRHDGASFCQVCNGPCVMESSCAYYETHKCKNCGQTHTVR